MSDYHKLSTQKYVDAVAKAEAKQIRAQEQQEAFRSMMMFAFALAVLGATMVAVYTMPNWLPSVGVMLEQAGLLKG
ncbi:MAG: hypothetical protein AAFN77_11055 [Planctomycetota bacterium]